MPTLKAQVHLDEAYTNQAVINALKNSSRIDWQIEEPSADNAELQDLDNIQLQWAEYELINWHYLARHATNAIANAYCIRKGLIRKSQLSYNITKYLSKHPESILRSAIPETWLFELDHVDYFEEAMNEVFEVERDLLDPDTDHMFIIKPSMANKGAGIKVFNSLEQLRSMFEEDETDSEDEDGEETDAGDGYNFDREDLTQVREWVIQRYIANPLLVDGRKFHIRAYVLAKSNIQVYLYRDMLALFAMKKYSTEDLNDSLIHLTNTCIQTDEEGFDEQASVKLFWELDLEKKDLEHIFEQMKNVLADIFDACTSEMTTFQAMPNAFELFGVDFMIDADLNVYFLEANEFPDFKQTGDKLQHIIEELFETTNRVAIEPFLLQDTEETIDKKMVKVYEKELLSL
ncbi:tubulin-tyrosine ligase family-domain-containing protein [Mycotypha africana]|uniref:tubulin-tyrosine ligase family-domain-containing protein n=1 Tax=Mycotypha africana TaxID=64632 RepID=UPI002301076C|nr:tubulin-tyrosine ligase family-domain-containing protein [Mycotypha africana]KAI8984643.1 tubulin-tyrosine ligase family-domain-containing protein [Mycotypha africana]